MARRSRQVNNAEGEVPAKGQFQLSVQPGSYGQYQFSAADNGKTVVITDVPDADPAASLVDFLLEPALRRRLPRRQHRRSLAVVRLRLRPGPLRLAGDRRLPGRQHVPEGFRHRPQWRVRLVGGNLDFRALRRSDDHAATARLTRRPRRRSIRSMMTTTCRTRARRPSAFRPSPRTIRWSARARGLRTRSMI